MRAKNCPNATVQSLSKVSRPCQTILGTKNSTWKCALVRLKMVYSENMVIVPLRFFTVIKYFGHRMLSVFAELFVAQKRLKWPTNIWEWLYMHILNMQITLELEVGSCRSCKPLRRVQVFGACLWLTLFSLKIHLCLRNNLSKGSHITALLGHIYWCNWVLKSQCYRIFYSLLVKSFFIITA